LREESGLKKKEVENIPALPSEGTQQPQENPDAKIAESPKEIEYKELLQRLKAEFDNYRHRTDLEKLRLIDYGREEVLRHFMEIYQQIEKAVELSKASEDHRQFYQGLILIKQAIEKKFNLYHVERVATVGEPFNAEVHEAISTAPVAAEGHEGKIVSEASPGFLRKKNILLPAKVVVGKFTAKE
jgi:molecular chaperone GrpE